MSHLPATIGRGSWRRSLSHGDLSLGIASALGTLAWLLLFATLLLGRTTPRTLSKEWLATFLGVALGTAAWYLAVYLLLRKSSGLAGGSTLRRCLVATGPMLLALPPLAAAYLSDGFFHFLSYNPIPRSVVTWSPALLTLLCQVALLIWSAPLAGSWRSRLLGPRVVPVLLFVTFAVLYVSSAGAHLYSPDEVQMYAVTRSIVERGSVAIPNDAASIAKGAPPVWYSKYGIVPSLLAVPPYWVSRLLGLNPDPQSPAFPLLNECYPLVGLLVGPLVTAATCALVYLLARRMGFRSRSSLAVTLLYGLTTSAWVYSKTFFTQPSGALFLLATVYLLLRKGRPAVIDWGLAGACFGIALGSRMEFGITTLPVWGVVAWPLVRDRFTGVRVLASFVAGLAVTAGPLLAWYNWTKTGSVLSPGYRGQETMAAYVNHPVTGIFGTLFSPGFSLFIFDPIVILGLIGIVLLVRRRRVEGYLFGGLFLTSLLLYGSFDDWFGGFTWGPRYFVVLLPLLVIPVAALLEHPKWGRATLPVACCVALLGIGVNVLGVLFDHNNGWLDLWDHGANLDLIIWDPHYSTIVAHLRLLRDYAYSGAKLDLFLYYKFGFPALLASLVLFTGFLTLTVRAALIGDDLSSPIKG